MAGPGFQEGGDMITLYFQIMELGLSFTSRKSKILANREKCTLNREGAKNSVGKRQAYYLPQVSTGKSEVPTSAGASESDDSGT